MGCSAYTLLHNCFSNGNGGGNGGEVHIVKQHMEPFYYSVLASEYISNLHSHNQPVAIGVSLQSSKLPICVNVNYF